MISESPFLEGDVALFYPPKEAQNYYELLEINAFGTFVIYNINRSKYISKVYILGHTLYLVDIK